jgi:signal transduction histidine kinase
MRRRWGLQAAMTATYVAVTAGAVLLTELVFLGFALVSPQRSVPLPRTQVQALVQATAAGLASKLGVTAGQQGAFPGHVLGTAGAPVTPGRAQLDGTGWVAIPQTGGPVCDVAPASFAVLINQARRVLATSYPACFPVGSAGAAAQAGVPHKVLAGFGWPAGGSGITTLPTGTAAWTATPVVLAGGEPPKGGAGAGLSVGSRVDAMLYVEAPAIAYRTSGISISPALAWSGLLVLAASVPAGLAFGLLSTRRLTRRLKRLAAATLEVADGEFGSRLPESGHDEVSQLERNFNRMAGQLQASMAAMRQLAEAGARQDERSRIGRELHDSISQELFSIQALAGGLRRALPPGSQVLTAVETMERTAGGAMREMRSLLLALRPVALDEAGLVAAIEGICHAYTERLGVRVRADLQPVDLPSRIEHAILRVTQEAVANAVRHSGAGLVAVRLGEADGHALLEVADDGRGFDVAAQAAATAGLGLRTMHDRVAEHGGELAITSDPATGTTVRACFPLEGR